MNSAQNPIQCFGMFQVHTVISMHAYKYRRRHRQIQNTYTQIHANQVTNLTVLLQFNPFIRRQKEIEANSLVAIVLHKLQDICVIWHSLNCTRTVNRHKKNTLHSFVYDPNIYLNQRIQYRIIEENNNISRVVK